MKHVNISCSISIIWSLVFSGDAEIFIAEDTGVVNSSHQPESFWNFVLHQTETLLSQLCSALSLVRLVVSKILIRSSPICFTTVAWQVMDFEDKEGRSGLCSEDDPLLKVSSGSYCKEPGVLVSNIFPVKLEVKDLRIWEEFPKTA